MSTRAVPVTSPDTATPLSATPPPSAVAETRPRRRWVSGQSLTAIVSSVVFFVLVMVVALAPVPFVSWSPGRTVNLAAPAENGAAAISIDGLPTHPLRGELRMTTVAVTSVDSRLGLLQALASHQLSGRDVLPRRNVYPPGKSVTQVKAEEIRMMDDSQAHAVIAALRAAGQPVSELPRIDAVSLSGPALNRLKPGDLVTAVDGAAVHSPKDVAEAIRRHKVGAAVVFTILRNGRQETQTLTTVASQQNALQPVVGIELGIGYQYTPRVSYGINPSIVGPSAGLVFALAIYDLITPDDLLAGRKVAGTGSITPEGGVRPIGGLQEKIRGAEKAGAQVFLVPADNCADLVGVRTKMDLVKVSTLRDAITGLQKLKNSPDGTGVPRCER